eukprot:423245-Prorocentrum_minimum.AAC.1
MARGDYSGIYTCHTPCGSCSPAACSSGSSMTPTSSSQPIRSEHRYTSSWLGTGAPSSLAAAQAAAALVTRPSSQWSAQNAGSPGASCAGITRLGAIASRGKLSSAAASASAAGAVD